MTHFIVNYHKSSVVFNDPSMTNLRIRIGGTSLLAGNTVDGVHVVVTHVSSLSGLVLRVESQRQVLWVHCSANMGSKTLSESCSTHEMHYQSMPKKYLHSGK